MAEKNNKFQVVTAIDLGTTYSGYAFSYCKEPSRIETKSWKSGTAGLMSSKSPTIVLLNPEGDFHSFGYDAERQYASLAEDDNHRDWALFRRFKMILYNEKPLSSEPITQDVNEKSAPAMKIFVMAIRYLKNEVVHHIMLQNKVIEERFIKFVITVPAIWDDGAKQFMRKAAEEAGIASDRLQLALEPEVASIWCRTNFPVPAIAMPGSGTRYMVVDLGGGTADISVHESLEDGSLKDIHRASGGPWGGMYVDENYKSFLRQIFGEAAVTKLRETKMEDYFDLLRAFEVMKRSFTGESNETFGIKYPSSLRNLQVMQDRIEELEYTSKIRITDSKLHVNARIVSQWFEDPVTKLINHIRILLSDPAIINVRTIVLVGGFSENKYVQNRVRKEIPGAYCIVPDGAGLAVLKGAVKFGHFPSVVKSRVLRYTYGVCVDKPFDSTIHTVRSKFFKLQYNDWRARDCFKVFATVDDEVRYDKELIYKFAQRGTLTTSVRIFKSSERSPVYVTDPGCELLGTIELNHTIDYVPIQITFMFGQTELLVKARLKESGRESIAVLDCFQKRKLKETGRGKPKSSLKVQTEI